ELDDAWLHLRGARVRVHATEVSLRVPPFARASSIRPLARAVALALAAALSALAAVWLTLRSTRDPPPRVPAGLRAIALGAAGPLVALVVLRLLERSSLGPAWRAVVLTSLPLVSLAAALATGLVTEVASPLFTQLFRRVSARVRGLLRKGTAA